MSVLIYAVDQPELAPLPMPARFRHDITYFVTPGGVQGVPSLPPGEYWIRHCDAREFLDEGVLRIVSPLDSDHRTEIEITEEQERWLQWMVDHAIQHVRLG